MICTDCKTEQACRLDMSDTAYGPRCQPVCVTCYNKTTDAIKAEFKRYGLGRAPRRVAFYQLRACEVNSAERAAEDTARDQTQD